MKYLEARLRQPDWMLHPMQEFIRHEDVVRYEELVSWQLDLDDGFEYTLFYVEADRERYRPAIEAVDVIDQYHISPIDDDSFYVWSAEPIRADDRRWQSAFAERELVVVPPVQFDREAAMWMTIVGHGEDLQAVLEDLPDDIEVTVDAVGTYDYPAGTLAGVLDESQREAVAAAFDRGYYEVPREASLADVADALGCAESTASERLRRAERDVFQRLLARYRGTGPSRADSTTGPRGRVASDRSA